MHLLGEDIISTIFFFFALVFNMWEVFLSVFQFKQTHESPLWRQTIPVCVLYKGKWNPPPKGCALSPVWVFIDKNLERKAWLTMSSWYTISPVPVSTPRYAQACLRWSHMTSFCQISVLGMCNEINFKFTGN